MTRILITLAALALIAGCGANDSGEIERNNDYVDAVNEANEDAFGEAQRMLTEIEEARGLREARLATERVVDGFDTAIADLEEVDPPEEVRDEHEALIAINRSGREQFQLLAELMYPGLGAEYAAATPGVLGEVSSLNREWNATIREINDVLEVSR